MKSYLITDPLYYTNNPTIFKKNLENIYKLNRPDIACFRDKTSTNTDELIDIFIQTSLDYNIQELFINSFIEKAKQFPNIGVHLTSSQFEKIDIAHKLGLKVILSCHNEVEIKKALEYKVNTITYSPIFQTPNKGVPKGIENLKKIIQTYPMLNIIALGGITSKEQIEEIKRSNAYGFASIRYFIDN